MPALADVVRAAGQAFLARFGDRVLPSHRRVLRAVARSHQRVVYAIILREAARALLDVVANSAYVGGLGAVMAVLHTWTRALLFHPHVHMLFPAGALAPDGASWKKPRKRSFIAPGYALGKRFRERVEVAFKKARLHHLVPAAVWRKRWVANVKQVGSGEQALLYLSRYVFRVAISDDRIERFDGSDVTYRWTDSATGATRRTTLAATDFLARFLQHVLPRGFKKVRYFGLWAPAHRAELAAARAILDHHPAVVATPERAQRDEPHDGTAGSPGTWVCRSCGRVSSNPPREIPRSRAPP